MLRLIIKFGLYYGILVFFWAVGWLPAADAVLLLGAAAVLAGVNTLIRPILVAVALPLNILTFGIASVFANLLALVIANAIIGGVMTNIFGIMLLIAFVIMLADDGVRNARQAIQKRLSSEYE